MTSDLVPIDPSIGQLANRQARNSVFFDHALATKKNTLRAQLTDLRGFSLWLSSKGIETTGEQLQSIPAAWDGVTWGLLREYKMWMVANGKAIATINRTIYTIRKYASLAWQSGILTNEEYQMFKSVTGYRLSQAIAVDEKRASHDAPTRIGKKKPSPTPITLEQEEALLSFPIGGNDVQLRNQLIMCLLLEHGLRRSELVLLTGDCFDMAARVTTFIRPKIGNKKDKQELMPKTFRALERYRERGHMVSGKPLLKKSWRGEKLAEAGLSVSSITRIVGDMGVSVGVQGSLSPHDCRHHLATKMEAMGYSMAELMQWFRWSSANTAMVYIEEGEVARRDKG